MQKDRVEPTGRGVWFQGENRLWHRSRYYAGKVVCVQVDGHRFYEQAASQPSDSGGRPKRKPKCTCHRSAHIAPCPLHGLSGRR